MLKLPLFKKSSTKPTKFLTLDINYESVRCLAFYKDDGTIKIIGSGVEYLEPGSVRNGVIIDFDQVVSQIQEAITKATQHIEENITILIIGTTSDLCQETVTTAKIKRATEAPISQKEIAEFEQKILDAAYLQVQQKYAEETGNVEEDFQVVTSSLVYSKLDNNKVTELINQEGSVVEMAMYTAHCPSYYVKTLQKLAKKLKLNLLAVSPENFALLRALQISELESNDMIFLHVGSDFTNVGVVFGGAIVANKSLPLGKKHFIEEISKLMGLTVEESTKVVESHARGELSNSESVIVQNCLSDVLDIWLEGIEILFSDFSRVKTFAPHIYLLGTGTQLPEIEETLTKNPWTKAIPFKAPPTINPLNITDLPKVVDATGAVNSNEWIIPTVLSFIFEEVI